ncbi:type I-E CRISPR-associated protein Cse1/CasA [Pseudonocardia oroxyli]|uniref:CRISPR-associated protein, Cse1 family n=1 Tax=Pseudonocardia oroxyli TaxID=366584 RepID=A0A1G8AF94_PSEOR|nr:type I-E CRISPR-associated protein Cse1/CasA [Pseudonocardia oroxyli]SDH19622.1 CRISPR-associated protein, Cse1 family [Pseudonocardia oroxyli]
MSLEGPLSFDLIYEPWIPCRERDGAIVEYGLLRTLGHAHELVGITGDLPTQAFALTRLLLAVLHAAIDGPRDLDEWEQLWEEDKLPVAQIEQHLALHRNRLDLFHPEAPFMQVADLRTAKGDMSDLSKLVADVPNGEPFFTTRLGGDLTLTFAEAARWVVHCQAFDISGIKSGAVGDERVKGGKGYPIGVGWSGNLGGVLVEGRTLRETLLLNLIAADFGPGRAVSTDRPVWERPPVGAAEEMPGGRVADGPVDLFTWQTRRIRLAAEGDRVTRVLLANGEKITPQNKNRFEPHTAWRRSEAQEKKPGATAVVYMPREHDPDRSIWRGVSSLLPALAAMSAPQKGQPASALSPTVVEWLGFLSTEEVLAKDFPVRLRAIGMVYGSQNSVVEDVVHDSIALRALLAERGAGDLAGTVESCVRSAERAALAVGGLAADLIAAAGGEGGGHRSRTLESVHAWLDPLFRDWLFSLRPDVEVLEAQETWHREVRDVVVGVARELLADISPAAWEGRMVRNQLLTAAHAESRFWTSLRDALPYAFTTEPVGS